MIIGVTGNIASGKSTIVNYIRETYHYPVIDADLVARKVVEPGEKALNQLVQTFGRVILNKDGALNRQHLGQIVFSNQEEREKLNRIVHPAVREQMIKEKECLLNNGHDIIVMDIPLLFENNLQYLVDKTVLVYTNEKIQLIRLMKRNGFTEQEAKSRMNAQLSPQKKKELADAIIDNSNTIDDSKKQVDVLFRKWELI